MLKLVETWSRKTVINKIYDCGFLLKRKRNATNSET